MIPDARPDPLNAARKIVDGRYPNADAAVVGGSAVRGEGSPTSDLDLLVIIDGLEAPYRESFSSHGWPVEAFVNNLESWRRFFESNTRRRRPSLLQLVSEGVVVRDRAGIAALIQAEARRVLEAGPPAAEPDQLLRMRYRVTDLLDDMVGARSEAEAYFASAELISAAVDLFLTGHGRWLARSKWVPRALREVEANGADRLVSAIQALYRSGDRLPLDRWVTEVLDEVGGRLFDGYHEEGSQAGWMARDRWDALVRGEDCPLCRTLASAPKRDEHGLTIADLPSGRLRLASDQLAKGYCVLISGRHVREPYELGEEERQQFYEDMTRVGAVLERLFGAQKINFEILGNSVPHLHVHIRPRYHGDPAPGRPIRPEDGMVTLSEQEYEARARAIREAVGE